MTTYLRNRRVGSRQLDRLREGLAERDMAVLRSIAALHYVTTPQVERLHFVNLDLPSRAAQRCLARLLDLHLVEHLDRRIGGARAGSASYVWRLSHAGARLLGIPAQQRWREPGLSHLAHVLEVAELVACLHTVASRARVEIIAIETEPSCWRPYFAAGQRSATLKPDLRVTLGVGDDELHWFVEIDRGTEHRPVLARKVDAYLTAWNGGGEQHRAGVFPGVLWIVPDTERATIVRQVCEAAGAPDGMFHVTTTDAAASYLLGLREAA